MTITLTQDQLFHIGIGILAGYLLRNQIGAFIARITAGVSKVISAPKP